MPNFYSYIFFKLSSFRDKYISNSDSPLSTIFTMAIIFIYYCLILVFYIESLFEVVIIPIHLYENNFFVLTIATIILVLHWLLFYRVTNYQELKKKYLIENKKNNSYKDYLVLFYMIFPFLLTAIFLIIVS